MASDRPSLLQRLFSWRQPRKQKVELGIANERDEALPVRPVDASASLRASATLNAKVTKVHAETTAKSTEGDVYVSPEPAGASGGASDPSVTIEPTPDRSSEEATATKLVDPDGAARRAASAGTRMPHLESGATEPLGNLELENEPGNLQLEGHSPDVVLQPDSIRQEQILQSPELRVEQIRQDIRHVFRGDKAAILKWASIAQDNAALLQAALDGARINDPETVIELRGLLDDQKIALANIERLIEDGATEEAAAEYENSIGRWVEAASKYLHRPGVVRAIRGFIAAGVIAWLGPAIATSWSGVIIAAVISGIGIDELKALKGLRDKKD